MGDASFAQTILGLSGILGALVVLLVVVWVALPFAVFGAKPLLRRLIEEQQRTNELLADLARRRPPG